MIFRKKDFGYKIYHNYVDAENFFSTEFKFYQNCYSQRQQQTGLMPSCNSFYKAIQRKWKISRTLFKCYL